MTNSRYEFNSHDHLMAKAAGELVEKLTRSNLLSAAQRLSVAKLQLVLFRLPKITGDFDLRVEIIGPRRNFGEIQTYHFWTLVIEGEMVTLAGGGHFYQPSSGGDSFSTFHWACVPGLPSQYSDELENLGIVPDAAPFDLMVSRIDFAKAQYEVEVTDSDNDFLEDDSDDDDDDDDDNERDSESASQADEDFEDTESESDDDDPSPGPLQIFPVDETERELAATIDVAQANRMPPQYAYGVEQCDFCKCPVENIGLLVDGDVREGGGWANMCSKCFEQRGLGVGWGKGQLYAKQRNGVWRMAMGFQLD